MQEALTLATTTLETKHGRTAKSLRESLRQATSAAHDRLDTMMRDAAGWTSRDDYAQFLQLQLAARAPVEAWLKANAPQRLCPPAQCEHIVRDLAALEIDASRNFESSKTCFSIPSASQHDGDALALGAAWTLAGSALGNRAILKDIRRAAAKHGHDAWPHSFLTDPDMLSFWGTLRRQIERPAAPEEICAATQTSLAVFDHFIECAEAYLATPLQPSVGAHDEHEKKPRSLHSCPSVHP